MLNEFDQIKAEVEKYLNLFPNFWGVITIDLGVQDGKAESFKIFPKQENIKLYKIKKP